MADTTAKANKGLPINPRLAGLQDIQSWNPCVACGQQIGEDVKRGRLCQECAEKDRREQAEKRRQAKAGG